MNESIKVCVETTVEAATDLAATIIKSIICEAVAEHGRCYLALAGGTTPHPLYQRLASNSTMDDVPWSAVEVFFGDERDVPLDDVGSNYLRIQRTLLDRVPVQPGDIHPMQGDAADLDRAAAEYEQTVRRIVPAGKDGIPRFDMILLGMGADGHTASLFPETTALTEKNKLVVANRVLVLGRSRMTFTYPLINAAKNVVLLVTGEDKADAVAALLGESQRAKAHLPTAGIKLKEGVLAMIFDAPAARKTNLKDA